MWWLTRGQDRPWLISPCLEGKCFLGSKLFPVCGTDRICPRLASKNSACPIALTTVGFSAGYWLTLPLINFINGTNCLRAVSSFLLPGTQHENGLSFRTRHLDLARSCPLKCPLKDAGWWPGCLLGAVNTFLFAPNKTAFSLIFGNNYSKVRNAIALNCQERTGFYLGLSVIWMFIIVITMLFYCVDAHTFQLSLSLRSCEPTHLHRATQCVTNVVWKN